MSNPRYTRTPEERRKATAAALASVRAERLNPSCSAIALLKQYAEGKIDADQLRSETLKKVLARIKMTTRK